MYYRLIVATALLVSLLAYVAPCAAKDEAATADVRPNIVLIFVDDQGYGDIGCFGATHLATPNLDRMAAEGIKFTDFYSGCPVCSGSRTALLTGCHYQRLSMKPVLFPPDRVGLNPHELTIAEVLKPLGYATGIVGKWHLGHLPQFLPTRQGFDEYFGIPYSNDMSIDPEHADFADDVLFREGMTADTARAKAINGKAPLMRGEKIIEYPADQTTLTQRYTAEAVKFIQAHQAQPFFLYLPHTMPHAPIFVSEKFKGRTKTAFGDAVEEVDWSVGEVLAALKACKIDDRTLVIYSTDNGTRGGSSGPLRGQKAELYEGGYRVPCIARWPGHVPAGKVCSEVVATIDMLPTIAAITGGDAPADRMLDGRDIRPLLFGEEGAKSPHEYYVLAHGAGAVRGGQWKFYPWGGSGKPKRQGAAQQGAAKSAVQLYDLASDLGETKNVAADHPEVVERLAAAYRAHLEDLAKNRRPAGQAE